MKFGVQFETGYIVRGANGPFTLYFNKYVIEICWSLDKHMWARILVSRHLAGLFFERKETRNLLRHHDGEILSSLQSVTTLTYFKKYLFFAIVSDMWCKTLISNKIIIHRLECEIWIKKFIFFFQIKIYFYGTFLFYFNGT